MGWAFVLLDERVDAWQVAGGTLVVVSLALFVITARRIGTVLGPESDRDRAS